ncbi:MAG: hypothetical protein M3N32_02065 [Actinomycetota bacterium]|nr:hypothetical protein [Actinomycetota bacterium]
MSETLSDWRLVDEIFRPALRAVLRAARELLTFDDPLDAELWATELVDMWRGLCLVEDDPERVYGQSLVRIARHDPAPEALACVSALAAVAAPPVARKARQAADELQRRGVQAPSWVAKLGAVRVVGAWEAGDPYGDQEAILLAFAHDGMQPHTFQLLVDHNFGGMVKDGFLTDTALEQVLDEWHPSEAWEFRAVDPAEATSKVRRGLRVRDHCLDLPESKSLEDCRILLDARLRLFPQQSVSGSQPLEEATRGVLLEAFFSSPEAMEAPDDGRLVSMILDYRCDFCGEDPLRWSPTVVLLFLLDWLPRKVTLPPEAIPRVPAVLRAWVRFAGKRRELPCNLIEEIVATIDEVEDDYLDAVRDPSNFGPAKAAVGAMLKDGVDVTDEAEVDAWLVTFKQRSEVERRQLLPA